MSISVSDLSVKAFYVYIIIKILALLILSVSNRYTGLVRAGIRYVEIMDRTIF